ncbi:hypothetical protein GCM10025771_14840 [Niveibacterium umoris]|uniref:Uncharacterized protein n=1 Tax=Niveibacterium umoris TaxID=1193620 RepID=A0A840BM66_9RHOO|nr:hypothetical protein [Niveibacterium umoris]MBB4014641.1 hypothetical protein [Niveibacterium umoris]
MKCPYCVSEIDAAALACPHCTRDLYLFKPLLSRIEALEQEVAEQKARLDGVPAASAEPQKDGAEAAVSRRWWPWVAPLLLLLLAHFTITIALDLPTLWLRVASLFIPLPFGFFALSGSQRSFGRVLIGGAAMALLSVLLMSAAIALIDHTPVLPSNAREWQEFLQYATSITMSFATGMILGRQRGELQRGELRKHAVLVRAVRALNDGALDPERLHHKIESLQKLIAAAMATGTTFASIATGLKDVVGG